MWNRALSTSELYNASLFLQSKYCIYSPGYNSTFQSSQQAAGAPLGATPRNSFAPSNTSQAFADAGTAPVGLTLFGTAQITPGGLWFPATGSAYAQLNSFPFGGTDWSAQMWVYPYKWPVSPTNAAYIWCEAACRHRPEARALPRCFEFH